MLMVLSVLFLVLLLPLLLVPLLLLLLLLRLSLLLLLLLSFRCDDTSLLVMILVATEEVELLHNNDVDIRTE